MAQGAWPRGRRPRRSRRQRSGSPSGAGSRSGPRSRSSSPGRRRSDRSVSVVLALSPWSAPFRNEEGLPFPGGLQNFLFFAVRSESLPSRPHSRPLNEDDNDDADKKVALHFAASERDGVGSCQRQGGGMCSLHA